MNELIRSFKIQKVLAIISIAGFALQFINKLRLAMPGVFALNWISFLLLLVAAVILFLYTVKQGNSFSTANTPSPILLLLCGLSAGCSISLSIYELIVGLGINIVGILKLICMFLSIVGLKLHFNKMSRITAIAALVCIVTGFLHPGILSVLYSIISYGAFVLTILLSAQAIISADDEHTERMHRAVAEDSFEAQFLKNINNEK